MKRLASITWVWLLVLLLLAAPAAAAPSPDSPIKPINGTLSTPLPSTWDFRPVGPHCEIVVVLDWVFGGSLQGTADNTPYMARVFGPCDAPPGADNEVAWTSGTFDGTVDGHQGTFDFVFESQMLGTDQIWRANIQIVPGSGTGDLATIQGSMKAEGIFGRTKTLTGWYRLK